MKELIYQEQNWISSVSDTSESNIEILNFIRQNKHSFFILNLKHLNNYLLIIQMYNPYTNERTQVSMAVRAPPSHKPATYNKEYFEVASAYRDRNRFPNPAEFVVELALTGQNISSLTSRDPVFKSTTIYPPPNLYHPITYPHNGYVFGPLINGGQAPSDRIVSVLPVVQNDNNQLSTIPLSDLENAYVGDTFELINKVGAPTTNNEFRTITDYDVITDQQLLTGLVDATAISATDIALTTATMDCDIDNFFVGWTVEFVATTDPNLLGVTRTVAYYRAVDRRIFFDEPIEGLTITAGDEVALKTNVYQLTLDSPLSVGALPDLSGSCEIAANATYRIRGSQQFTQGTLTAGTTTSFTLPAAVGDTDFTGFMLWIVSDPVVASGTLASTAASTFTLPGGFAGQFVDDFLNNMQINITAGGFADTTYTIRDWDDGTLTGTIEPAWDDGGGSPGAVTFTITQPTPNQYRLINSYNTTTRVGTVTPAFSYTNQQGTVTPYAVGATDLFELMQFTTDNYHPLEYTSAVTAQQQDVCYEIQLTSLTLPTLELTTGCGGTILKNYPYVYVEFNMIHSRATPVQIYSNNPNTKNMMFRAPVIHYEDNVQDFITLDGHGMCQTLKFSPNDAFRFSVHLPNGDLFTTDPDYLSPSEPDPKKQITACFSIRRT